MGLHFLIPRFNNQSTFLIIHEYLKAVYGLAALNRLHLCKLEVEHAVETVPHFDILHAQKVQFPILIQVVLLVAQSISAPTVQKEAV